MKKVLFTSVGMVVFLLLLPTALFGHETGASIEQEVNGYVVDIGYDTDSITANAPVRFDFSLYDANGKEEVMFERVWFRIEQNAKTIFATGIARPALGATGAVVLFPEAGAYTLYARFEDKDQSLVELETPITAAAQGGEAKIPWQWALGVVAALGAGFFFGKRLRKTAVERAS